MEKITIETSRYEQLIRAEQKAEQYKKLILDSTNNNQLIKIMTCIEGKNLYELIKESQKEEK